MKLKLKKAAQGMQYPMDGTPGPMQQVPQGPPLNQNPSQNPQDPNSPGTQINWNHVLNSYLATGLAQGLVQSFSPNSQQNTTQRFNRERFNPTNFLPYTANYSNQDRFGIPSAGMRKGGQVKMEDGGFPSTQDMSESMRKWILNDDEQQPPVQQEAMEQAPQVATQDDSLQQMAQFNMFVQMFGWDAADQEKEPEDQSTGYIQKKGGKIKKWAQGGPGPDKPGQQVQMDIQGQTSENHDLNRFELLQQMIGSGISPFKTTSGRVLSGWQEPLARKLINSAYIFNQRPEVAGMSPEQRVNAYSTSPSNDPEVQAFMNKMNIWTRGSNLSETVDKGVQDIVSHAEGGPVTDAELYHILGDEVDEDGLEYLKKGGWIQKANASIKRRGTKGVCTGSKFGSSSCPKGSRRYALAKTFKAMAKHRKKEDGGTIGPGDGDRSAVSTTNVAHPQPAKIFTRTSNGQPVQPSYEFIPPGSNAADSAQYMQGFYNALHRMSSGKLGPMTDPAFLWTPFGTESAARNPGVDVPGKSNMFNSGVREGYMNMPTGSFQYRKKGGNTYQQGGEYDMSPEEIIGLIGQGYDIDV